MLEILDPGFLTSIQDAGRTAWGCLGVPRGGAMDEYALRMCNHLVGNPADFAILECYAEGPLLYAHAECLVAAGGAGFELWIENRRIPLWMAARVRAGERLRLWGRGRGRWGTLAVSGGFDVPEQMGSRSTNLRAGFGGLDGRTLRAGDCLSVGSSRFNLAQLRERAALRLPADQVPEESDMVTLEVIPGPQEEMFTAAGLETFYSREFTLSERSDRMGYRLEGEKIEHTVRPDILSEGVLPGAVQVPGDGCPVILMADAQSTGGYAKIAYVIRADLPLLAQMPPGRAKIRFRRTTVEAAQQKVRHRFSLYAP